MMIKAKDLFVSGLIFTAAIFASCSNDSSDNTNALLAYKYAQAFNAPASQSKVNYKTTVVSEISETLKKTTESRFSNFSDIVDDSTKIIICASDKLQKNKDSILKVYENGGIVAVYDYDEFDVEDFAATNPVDAVAFSDPDDPHIIYAFTKSGQHFYIDDYIKDFNDSDRDETDSEKYRVTVEEDVLDLPYETVETPDNNPYETTLEEHSNFMFNNFVAFINDYFASLSEVPVITSRGDASYISKPQYCMTHVTNVKLDEKIDHLDGSGDRWAKGSGCITTNYKVTPVHVCGDKANGGDYYIVEGWINISSGGMWNPTNSWHGGYHWNFKGFWPDHVILKNVIGYKEPSTLLFINRNIFKDLCSDLKATIQDFPVPKTSNGSIEYGETDSQTWKIDGKVSGELGRSEKDGVKGGGKLEVSSGYSHTWGTNQKTKIMDVSAGNITDHSYVGWKIMFNNGPDKEHTDRRTDAMKTGIDIPFHWVWFVPNGTTVANGAKIEDDSTENLYMKVYLAAQYNTAHWWTGFWSWTKHGKWHVQGWKRGAGKEIGIKIGDTDLTNYKIESFDWKLPAPSRISMGSLIFSNPYNEVVDDIELYEIKKSATYQDVLDSVKGGSAKPSYIMRNYSIGATTKELSFDVPTGNYVIKFLYDGTAYVSNKKINIVVNSDNRIQLIAEKDKVNTNWFIKL